MKNKIISTFTLVLAFGFIAGAFGQNSMTLTFTGVYDSSFFQLDSLKVKNLTQDCDTVLYYPDTVLTIYNVGLNEDTYPGDDFRVMQNYPNPSADETSVRLYMPEKGRVTMSISDVAGRRIISCDRLLDKGFHSFRLSLPGSGIFIFNACCENRRSSIRIISANAGHEGPCSIIYSGEAQSETALKSKSAVQDFLFTPGDELMMIGYGEELESGFIDYPETGQDYVFQFATNIPCPGLDSLLYEGQWYHTVQIFSQCWIIENMNAGVMIPSSQSQTNNGVMEKYCMGDVAYYCSLAGGLYFWDEMMDYTNITGGQGICPDGFHIPRDVEWQVLEGAADSASEIGASGWKVNGWRGTDAGGNLKQTGFDFWEPPNTGATDKYGFSAIAGGYFVQGSFWGPGYKAYFYSSDVYGKYYRNMDWNQAKIQRGNGGGGAGFSVRCIRN